MSRRGGFTGHKADKENARRARKQAKAERLAYRRAAKLAGVEIDRLPEGIQGVARTLANGDDLMSRQSG